MPSLRLPTWLAACVVVLTLAVSINLRDLAAWMGTPIPKLPIPYGGALLDNGLGVLLVLVVAVLLLRPTGLFGRPLA